MANKFFAGVSDQGLQESEDRLGGYSALDTDVYTGKIKAAYAGESSGGARSATIIIPFGSTEYRETIYFTNKKKENFFLNKNDNTKKVPLPGFTILNDICLCTLGIPLEELDEPEEKVMNIYDKDAGKEIPKAVPMMMQLIGQEVTVAIVRSTENQTEKSGDEYVAKADGSTRNVNNIDKVFNTESGKTVAEGRANKEAAFQTAWLEKNKGVTRDKTSKSNQGGTAGAPVAGGAAGSGSGARKSLFGS